MANKNNAADSHEPRTLVLLGSSPRLMPAADLISLGITLMKSIEISSELQEPQELHRYPDFLLTALIKSGPGRIESVRDAGAGTINLVLTSRATGQTKTLVTARHGHFRAILARLGFRLGDSPYATHSLFSIEAECAGIMRKHRFGFYLCNEPAMDFWLRLYLYGIDGVWPLNEEKSQHVTPANSGTLRR